MNHPLTDETVNIINEFLDVMHGVYGTYLDATKGFVLGLKQLDDAQTYSLGLFSEKNPELATVEHLDTLNFFYGKGEPGKPDSITQHVCTQGELKQRNSKGGRNYKFMGNMSLVSIYSYWEDYYRGAIANTMSCGKNDIKIPVFNDLRHLRRSIIHRRGIAIKDVSKCEVLKWFSEGEDVFIDESKLEEIIIAIEDGISWFFESVQQSPAT